MRKSYHICAERVQLVSQLVSIDFCFDVEFLDQNIQLLMVDYSVLVFVHLSESQA
jgi:hypothetical protein